MRIEIEFENKHVAFGVDRVTGVFVQIANEEGIFNWSEFYPFQQRLTVESLKQIKKLLTKEEYKQVVETPLIDNGYWSLYFEGICTTQEVDDDFEYPKRLLSHYYDGEAFKIRNLKNYFNALKHFKEPVTFWEVHWYQGIDRTYSFNNDYTAAIFS